jgi:hypothetical protein
VVHAVFIIVELLAEKSPEAIGWELRIGMKNPVNCVNRGR